MFFKVLNTINCMCVDLSYCFKRREIIKKTGNFNFCDWRMENRL